MLNNFGMRLKLLRKKRGLTMEQLGTLVGVAKTTISGYENSSREPPLHVINKLAHSLSTSADYLLGLTECMEQPLLQACSNDSIGNKSVHWNGILLEESELIAIKELLVKIQERAGRISGKEARS